MLVYDTIKASFVEGTALDIGAIALGFNVR